MSTTRILPRPDDPFDSVEHAVAVKCLPSYLAAWRKLAKRHGTPRLRAALDEIRRLVLEKERPVHRDLRALGRAFLLGGRGPVDPTDPNDPVLDESPPREPAVTPLGPFTSASPRVPCIVDLSASLDAIGADVVRLRELKKHYDARTAGSQARRASNANISMSSMWRLCWARERSAIEWKNTVRRVLGDGYDDAGNALRVARRIADQAARQIPSVVRALEIARAQAKSVAEHLARIPDLGDFRQRAIAKMARDDPDALTAYFASRRSAGPFTL